MINFIKRLLTKKERCPGCGKWCTDTELYCDWRELDKNLDLIYFCIKCIRDRNKSEHSEKGK